MYWHFRKKCFSVKHKGRVVAHVNDIVLEDVTFKVSEKGNERVRREGVKNVHAFVYGRVFYMSKPGSTTFFLPGTSFKQVKYNPYKYKTFVDSEKQPVYNSELVVCSTQKGVMAK